VGPRAGLREQGSIRVLGRGNRHTEMCVSAGASHHIGYDVMQPDDRPEMGPGWVMQTRTLSRLQGPGDSTVCCGGTPGSGSVQWAS
jgi:hypothetical protein